MEKGGWDRFQACFLGFPEKSKDVLEEELLIFKSNFLDINLSIILVGIIKDLRGIWIFSSSQTITMLTLDKKLHFVSLNFFIYEIRALDYTAFKVLSSFSTL